MKRLNNSGFTIIETTLFLAISGALIGALMIGTWSSINYQRYRDSVTSLESLIKQQYSDVENVVNNRPDSNSCNTTLTKPGQSDCVVLGRYLAIDGGGNISTSTVYGYRFDSNPADDGKEITALNTRYHLYILDGSTENSQLEWGAKIAWPVSGLGSKNPTTPRIIAFLFLHSPTSSLIYTFSITPTDATFNIGNPSSDNLKSMIVDNSDGDPGRSIRNICVDSGDGFNKGMSVWVEAMAFDSSAVQIHSNDMDPLVMYGSVDSAFYKDQPKC